MTNTIGEPMLYEPNSEVVAVKPDDWEDAVDFDSHSSTVTMPLARLRYLERLARVGRSVVDAAHEVAWRRYTSETGKADRTRVDAHAVAEILRGSRLSVALVGAK